MGHEVIVQPRSVDDNRQSEDMKEMNVKSDEQDNTNGTLAMNTFRKVDK